MDSQDGLQPAALRIARTLCLRFEGLRLRPYLCPAGVPTIGVGSTRYEDGTPVRLTDEPITRERAIQLLDGDLRRRLPQVLALCRCDSSGRLAAITDLAYNIGLGNLRASTLRRKVNEGDWEAASVELLKWVRGGGRVLAGLVARRGAEAALL